MPNFADQNKPFPPPSPDEYGLYVRPIFSGSNPNILEVSLGSGSLNIGNISGSFTLDRPDSSALYVVPAVDTAVIVASGNLARMGLTIFNDSPGIMYIRLGAGVATNAFTVKLSPQDFYEPQDPIYTGVVTGLWRPGGSGSAFVTENLP